jgi:surfactin synthase thioesterase subunit
MLAVAAALLTGAPAEAGSPRVEGPFGKGSAAVWLVRAVGQTRAIVVFGHGWKVAPPSPSYPWVGQFLPWLEHLARRGDAVVFPRYQLGGDAPGAPRAADFEAGIRSAFARLSAAGDVPVVAVGYSYGASLAFTYAANARAWRLPAPVAIDAVFPAPPIPGVPLPRLPRRTRVLVQVGDADTEAGRGGADAFWHWLGDPSPLRRYDVVRSHDGFVANHAAPKQTTPSARMSFWAPLDRLVTATAPASITHAQRAMPPVVSIGSGADEVWIMQPRGRPRDIVVFAHGWSTPVPSDWAPWLDHLREGGSLVIYPRYEAGAGDSPTTALAAFRRGVVAAFRRLRPTMVPVVALGKSFGAAAIFEYGAEARQWGVPPPSAIVSIFPALPIGGLPALPLGPEVFAEVIVGDADTVAGRGGADAFWHWLSGHPANAKRYVVIRSRPGFTATHDSAQQSTAIARAVFWRPVDALLARLRAAG